VSTSTAISITVSVALAVAGYLAKYWNDVRIDQRRARLDRVGRQLSELYGPLLALSYAGRIGWEAACTDIRPTGPDFVEQAFSDDEATTFRLWMTTVLQPINRQIVDVIQHKSDLLIEEDMPEVLLQVCANVLAFEAVLKRWEHGDFTRTWSFMRFPGDELQAYTETSFEDLKAEQVDLLGKEG
jgi:hypothetical protein